MRAWHGVRSPRVEYFAPVGYTSGFREPLMTPQHTVQLVAGILAVVLVGIIILRRKGKKKTEEDEF